MTGAMCDDNRFELIEKYKNKLIDGTNIETSKDEMAVIESILFRFWQMGWLDKLEEYERQKAEIERLLKAGEEAVNCFARMESLYKIKCKELEVAKSEAIEELSEKITEIFMRYAHLHSYAEGARKDYIETVDGKEIEMQSVWDVITLQMNGIAEYEEMGRLQKNIETIEKERLLTELEKDFRLLVKEMAGE